jgi:hypothetical protein
MKYIRYVLINCQLNYTNFIWERKLINFPRYNAMFGILYGNQNEKLGDKVFLKTETNLVS